MPANTPSVNSMRAIASQYDIHAILGTDRKVIVCPMPFHHHESNTPSFSIFTNAQGRQRFRCFGSCSTRGDSLDLIGFMRIPGYRPNNADDVKAAVTLLQSGYQIAPIAIRQAQRKKLPFDLYKMFPLGDAVVAYGKTRGLKSDTLEAFGVGQADKKTLSAALERLGEDTSWVKDRIYMTLPTFHFGTLMMVKLRDIHAKEKRHRFIAIPGSSPGLFNFANIYNCASPIAIVKGEIPSMVLWERGLPHNAAPTAGEATIDEKWGVFVNYSSNRIVIGDNDPEKVKEQLSSAYKRRCEVFRAKLYFPPDNFHDLDQWVLADPNAADQIKRWMFEGVEI